MNMFHAQIMVKFHFIHVLTFKLNILTVAQYKELRDKI